MKCLLRCAVPVDCGVYDATVQSSLETGSLPNTLGVFDEAFQAWIDCLLHGCRLFGGQPQLSVPSLDLDLGLRLELVSASILHKLCAIMHW